MAAIFIQAGVPVLVGVALVTYGFRKQFKKNTLRAKEMARGRKRFEFFANGA